MQPSPQSALSTLARDLNSFMASRWEWGEEATVLATGPSPVMLVQPALPQTTKLRQVSDQLMRALRQPCVAVSSARRLECLRVVAVSFS